jgi:predicted esterase
MNINPADHETRRMHLPRIMCLHGGGTNTRIFRAQCRVLERMLRPHFRLCYAQAPFFSQAGPDVQSVYSDFGPFRAWLRWSPDNAVGEVDGVSEEIIAAIDSAMEEDNSYGADGEWVGLLGFSQGAKICASILHSQQERARGQHHWPNFRFAMLIAGRGPLVALHSAKSNAARDASRLAHLHIPTIHVHGLNDPNLHLHRRLFYEHCKGNSASLIEWDGGHRVPVKTGHVRTLVDEVLAVFQRTRQRAGTRQKAGFRVGFGEA